MNSIRRTLLIWLSIGISASIVMAAGLIYSQAREEANILFDYQMKQLVASLPTQSFAQIPPPRLDQDERRDDIVIQMWDNTGVRIYRSHEHLFLPQRAELGFSTIVIRDAPWRIYSVQLGNTVVQVAQPMNARLALAARMALKTIAPLLLLFPFLALLIWLTVRRGLSSVQRAATDVQTRDVRSLAPINDRDMPQEIRPLTAALNDLLARLDSAISAQRTFVADAAHELKTPLAALTLQLQLAERAATSEERKLAFDDLKLGLERATHLVHQLLTLARQEPDAFKQKMEDIDLLALMQDAVGEFAVLASHKQIDLGCNITDPARIKGDADALRTLLYNLIDNAIRYSPPETRIDVSLKQDGGTVSLTVQDNGPGIPEEDLARVPDRFYRVPGTVSQGSGLGLAIVSQIAKAHGARLMLANTHPGLSARVDFQR